jgi:hypothetical protein
MAERSERAAHRARTRHVIAGLFEFGQVWTWNSVVVDEACASGAIVQALRDHLGLGISSGLVMRVTWVHTPLLKLCQTIEKPVPEAC